MIDFTEIVIYLLGLVGAGVGTFLMYWLKRLGDKFGVETNEKMNNLINEAVERGLGFAAEQLSDDGKKLTRSVKNEFVEEAASYVISGTPKALSKLGITEDRVREIVKSRLTGRVPEDDEEEISK